MAKILEALALGVDIVWQVAKDEARITANNYNL